MSILVTGSEGFIGKRLVLNLEKKGLEVIKIDKNKGVDILNKEELSKIEDINTIVHLASLTSIDLSFKDPEKFLRDNYLGLLNILELAKRNKAKVIFASTVVYKESSSSLSEESTIAPKNPYSMSKYIGENLCKVYGDCLEVPTVVLRLFNVYGNGQSNQFLVPKIMKGIEEGKVEFLYGVESKRDWVYIKDVVLAFEKAIELNTPGFNVFNIGVGKSHSVKEVLDKILEISQKQPEVVFSGKERVGTVSNCVANISKAQKLLNWTPLFSLEEGLKDMIQNE
jgi:GDP-4-dehydro-6-deoxy-D-mannose reductase